MKSSFLATKYVGFATHTAPNHPDEVLAYAMLISAGLLSPDAPVVHTRDQDLLEDLFSQGYFIADVGGKNIPGWMDHHQDRNLPAASSLVANVTEDLSSEVLAKALQIISDRDCNPGEGLKKWPPHVADLGEVILLLNGEEDAWKKQVQLCVWALTAWYNTDLGGEKRFDFSFDLPWQVNEPVVKETSLLFIGQYLSERAQAELQARLVEVAALLQKRYDAAKKIMEALKPLGNGAFLAAKEINLSQALGWGLSVPESMKLLVMPGEDQPGTWKVSATRGNSVPEAWATDERVAFRHPAGFFARIKTLALFEGN